MEFCLFVGNKKECKALKTQLKNHQISSARIQTLRTFNNFEVIIDNFEDYKRFKEVKNKILINW